jgi:hypothetical protein
MATGRLSTCKEQFAAEFFGPVSHEVFGCVVAVVGTCRPGVLGCEAVPDGDYGQVEVVGHVFQVRVLAFGVDGLVDSFLDVVLYVHILGFTL